MSSVPRSSHCAFINEIFISVLSVYPFNTGIYQSVYLRSAPSTAAWLSNRPNQRLLTEIGARHAANFLRIRVWEGTRVDVHAIDAAAAANKRTNALARQANASLSIVADHRHHDGLFLVIRLPQLGASCHIVGAGQTSPIVSDVLTDPLVIRGGI